MAGSPPKPQFKPVEAVSPPAAYIGGKRLLAPLITQRIDEVDHSLYAEPFVGMGGVFFRRTRRPRAEVINDFSGEVINLLRMLQRHYPALMAELKFSLSSRREYHRHTKSDPTNLTELERAVRFLYLQKTAYGGNPSGLNFGVDHTNSRFNMTRIEPLLERVFNRLSKVVIENLEWAEFMRRYDRSSTLFYLDPPYWGNENDYGKNLFDRDQFKEMAKALRRIKGKAILSLNDRPEVRATFTGFRLETVRTSYTVGPTKGGQKKVGELLIYSWG